MAPAVRWQRVIAHADMDAFYAAVEQHDRPELRGKPVIVGHPGKRGVVLTASYEARPSGVGSAMPMSRAVRLCPAGIVVAPRFERYQEVSRLVMAAFGTFSPLVEPLSLDEAFLDLTGTEALFGAPELLGRKIQAAVREATGLTVSVGVAATKFVAKVASDLHKPAGLTVVPPETEQSFLGPLPVRKLWGVGPKAEERLLALGIRTIGELAAAGEERLRSRLGEHGGQLALLARGEDPREVVPDRDARSVGAEETLEEDVTGAAAIRPHLLRAADRVAARLRHAGLRAGGIRVKLKSADFQLHTRQAVLPRQSSNAGELYAAALALLPAFELSGWFRLVGLAGYDLGTGSGVQGELFGGEERKRQERLDRTLDRLRERFGEAAVRRGSDLP